LTVNKVVPALNEVITAVNEGNEVTTAVNEVNKVITAVNKVNKVITTVNEMNEATVKDVVETRITKGANYINLFFLSIYCTYNGFMQKTRYKKRKEEANNRGNSNKI
jgi:hypothetical protein